MHLIIDRKSWSRGKGKHTKLLNDDNEKDCIGFLLLASGFKAEQILNLDEPIDIIRKYEWISPLIEWAGSASFHSALCNQIVKLNDSADLKDNEREIKLCEAFKSIDIDLEFVE